MSAASFNAVSVHTALLAGWRVARHHRALVVIATFAVLCERAVTLYVLWTGVSLREVALQYQEMLGEISRRPFAGADIIEQYRALYAFMGVVGVLFALGAFLLVGLLGLLRDVLMQRSYQPREIVRRGKEFFWRVVRFKIPIYLAISATAVCAAPVLFSAAAHPALALLPAIAAALALFGVGFIGRVFLSLGPKVIVATGIREVLPVYGLIFRLVRPYTSSVFWFYTAVAGITSLTLLVPTSMSFFNVPVSIVIVSTMLIASFITVFAKAAAFAFYLQLDASVGRSTDHRSKSLIYG